MISSLFFPIFPFILHSITFIIWASIAIWLASWGQENCRQLSNLNTTSINGNNSSCNCNTIGITTMVSFDKYFDQKLIISNRIHRVYL